MDAVTLILTALAAGAKLVAEGIASEIIAILIRILKRKFSKNLPLKNLPKILFRNMKKSLKPGKNRLKNI